MIFPLHKNKFAIRDNIQFLNNYTDTVELPVGAHPGSFGFRRKNHIHEGLDFYCEQGDEVYAMEDGIVVSILDFTGQKANSPWWNDTQSILIQHTDFCLNYGELEVKNNLHIGDLVQEGQFLGKVTQVLKKDKGRPMNMLHLEMYKKYTTSPVVEWGIGFSKPEELLDPTNIMKRFFK